jgi:hypothetical protein
MVASPSAPRKIASQRGFSTKGARSNTQTPASPAPSVRLSANASSRAPSLLSCFQRRARKPSAASVARLTSISTMNSVRASESAAQTITGAAQSR